MSDMPAEDVVLRLARERPAALFSLLARILEACMSDDERLKKINEMADDPAVADGDIALLRAAIGQEPVIEITSKEQFMALAEAAQVTHRHFQEQVGDMTQERAAFVRTLRVENSYTWRSVAGTCALEWGGDWGSNQLAGMAICERAAQWFSEDYMREPWN